MSSTLILNSSYEPLKVIHWSRAVCMWLSDKVEILSTYSERVYSAIDDWNGFMPAVVRLLKYVKTRRNRVKFSRINVYGRDHFTCMYCGIQPRTENLTFDHVLPRSRGGKTCWENIVTACLPCNEKKANRTPEEAGMHLKKKPARSTVRPTFRISKDAPSTPDEWREYLYWQVELES